MGGGHLAVLDRLGRETKRFALVSGAATIGRGAACDIRVMLPAASPHHATVVMHDNQAVLRSVKSGATLVNGRGVSVWRLRDGDTVSIAGRELRWHEESSPGKRPRATTPLHTLVHKKAGRSSRSQRRVSAGVNAPNRLRIELEALHRASMPATSGGKQVAVVQPQRRDNTQQQAVSSKTDDVRRVSTPNISSTATKASMWIESRKSTGSRGGRGGALRLSVLKKQAVLKIQPPLTIDHTKQAALMLMAGHTPKPRSPSFLVHKFTPSKKNVQGRKSGRGSKSISPKTPANNSTNTISYSTSARNSTRGTRSVVDITDSDTPSTSRQSTVSRKSTRISPQLGSPKKSAMKQPSSKRHSRKTESIKFDLSNLENHDDDIGNEIVSLTDTRNSSQDHLSDSELSLHYSDTSSVTSPSPRRSIHSSRSSTILRTTGVSMNEYSQSEHTRTLTPESPRARKSLRGSMIVSKSLENSKDGSKRMTKTLTDHSNNTTVASAFRTRTLSPRKSNLESYSVVDLVSIDSNESGKNPSIYNSADSINSSAVTFGTPRNSNDRKSTRQSRMTMPSRSTLGTSLLGSSTPYVAKNNRSKRSNSSPNISSVNVKSSISTRRSKSVTTPENQNISINSTRMSRASRYRSRINDSDLLLISPTENASPKTSRKSNKIDKSSVTVKNSPRISNRTVTLNDSELNNSGLVTPENRHSPVEVGTPVLSIQNLLNSSQSSLSSTRSQDKGRRNASKRKTIAAVSHIQPKKGRNNAKSISLYIPARKSLRLSSDESPLPDDEVVTPKSAVKLVQEAVKNKHSTEKKPQSKRSLIDNLDESDIVKQLFSSPVKRNLSQSMTEFSRKHFSDDSAVRVVRKPTRQTVALTRRTLDNSLLDNSIDFSTEAFVSPLSTPGNSPNLSTVKRLYQKNTPDNDIRDVRGVKALLKTPRTRQSTKNDLSNVSGLKNVFVKSPKNSLSDIRGVKKMFAPSPTNDLSRVTGVHTLFRKQKTPKNDLSDVRGVKALFTRSSPRNDYRNVSGVKKTFAKGQKNSLSDLRGVKQMYGRRKRQTDYNNVSGVEDLFNESFYSQKEKSTDLLFDQLLGKHTVKAVYSKSFTKQQPKSKTRNAKSLHASMEGITNNVEKWLEEELRKRLHKDESKISSRKSRELQLLATDTVEGSEPIRMSRSRNSTIIKSLVNDATRKLSASDVYSAHTLPIKKRSIVEKSLEKSINKSNRLPIKKRVVVHSTPVKGRYNLTMNASELGRVSPIVADKTKLAEHDTSVTLQAEKKKSPKPKTPKARKTARQAPTIPETESAKASPRKTRRTKATKASPQVLKTTRARRTVKSDENSASNVKKRRSSLVIAKKSPVGKPKATKNSTSKVQTIQNIESPKKTRNNGRQKQDVEVILSPKRTTRAKARRNSVVVSKPSPKMKPQNPRAKKAEPKTLEISSEKTTRSRKITTKDEIKENKKKTLKDTAEPTKTRGRRTTDIKSPKTTRGNTEKETKPPAKRGRKAETVEVANAKRGRRIPETSQRSSPSSAPRSRRAANQTTEIASTRGRKSKPVQTQSKTESPKKTEPEVKKTRGKKIESQISLQSEPPAKRGRKTNDSNKTEPVTRNRRTKADEKNTSRKLVKSKSEEMEKKTRGRKTTEEKHNKTQVETRRMKSEGIKEAPSRGRKAAPVVAEEKPKRGGRKRKSEEPIDNKKQPAKKSRKSPEVTSPVKRATRGKKPVEDTEKPVGRRQKR